MAPALFLVIFPTIFVLLERAMIRSARKTTKFTDPAMRSVVGLLAERSMTIRYIVGTIGVLVASMMGAMILVGILSVMFGFKM